MSIRTLTTAVLAVSVSAGTAGAGSTVGALLAEYGAAGAGPFDPKAGAALWTRAFPSDDGARSCADCHTADPARQGRHATTGKPIAPLAPSAEAKRLSDRGEVEKWLLRNCKWTLGRPCTAQEKGDLLSWLSTR